MKSVVVKLLTMRLASQLVGSITAIGILVLTVYFFPRWDFVFVCMQMLTFFRTILEYTWREEQSNYERATKVSSDFYFWYFDILFQNRIKFHEKIDAEAVKVDRLLPTNLTGKQLDCMLNSYSSSIFDTSALVELYSVDTYFNESSITEISVKFVERQVLSFKIWAMKLRQRFADGTRIIRVRYLWRTWCSLILE